MDKNLKILQSWRSLNVVAGIKKTNDHAEKKEKKGLNKI